MQKVCFSDREKFSESYHPPKKIGKTQHNTLYESRWKTQHNALYESRWKTQHNALYESRWKTQHNALYESRCGVGTKLYRGFCRNSDDRS
ncbi:hypothetical protein LEP1GSC079_4569 [Leptospira interrogans str. FPW1039]|uniref:Uncharacterized protein n=1 Tax=Leptospira interrogans str. FPW1039 TaxID=1193040 RepID=A0A0F6IA07_LEPIR|nr:hypothetical protein LEP1GSC079_4569 [Leptospira interrogans str. FPW1039]